MEAFDKNKTARCTGQHIWLVCSPAHVMWGISVILIHRCCSLYLFLTSQFLESPKGKIEQKGVVNKASVSNGEPGNNELPTFL